jgi:hypothetical protein
MNYPLKRNVDITYVGEAEALKELRIIHEFTGPIVFRWAEICCRSDRLKDLKTKVLQYFWSYICRNMEYITYSPLECGTWII